MMAVNIRQRQKPASLSVQVMHAERQVLERRRIVKFRIIGLGRTIHRQLTSPVMLLWAGGLGFAAGLFPTRHASKPGNTDRPRGPHNTFFGSAMKLIALVRTLSSVFSLATDYHHQQDGID